LPDARLGSSTTPSTPTSLVFLSPLADQIQLHIAPSNIYSICDVRAKKLRPTVWSPRRTPFHQTGSRIRRDKTQRPFAPLPAVWGKLAPPHRPRWIFPAPIARPTHFLIPAKPCNNSDPQVRADPGPRKINCKHYSKMQNALAVSAPETALGCLVSSLFIEIINNLTGSTIAQISLEINSNSAVSLANPKT